MLSIIRRLVELNIASKSSRHVDVLGAEDVRVRRILSDFMTTELGEFTPPDDRDYALWREGKLSPLFIATLVDRHNTWAVPAARVFTADQPQFAEWKAGRKYPCWDQTCSLARDINIRIRDFAHPDIRPRTNATAVRPLMGVTFAVLDFELHAVTAQTAHSASVNGSDGATTS